MDSRTARKGRPSAELAESVATHVRVRMICRVGNVDRDRDIWLKPERAGSRATERNLLLARCHSPDICRRTLTLRQIAQCFQCDEGSNTVVEPPAGDQVVAKLNQRLLDDPRIADRHTRASVVAILSADV